MLNLPKAWRKGNANLTKGKMKLRWRAEAKGGDIMRVVTVVLTLTVAQP